MIDQNVSLAPLCNPPPRIRGRFTPIFKFRVLIRKNTSGIVISEGGAWFYCGVCDGCKKHTGEKAKTSLGVLDHCSSPLEGSTQVRFSRGGGVFYRIAGGKPNCKKSKPAGFGHFSPMKSVRRYTAKN